MAGPRALRFAFAIAGAAAMLVALASETLDSLQGANPGVGAEHVRWIAAGGCLVAALVARRMSSTVEAKGFVVAALALALSVVADHLLLIVSKRLGTQWSAWLIPVHAAQDLLSLGVPIVVGVLWIGIPTGDLLRPSPAPLRDYGTVVLTGLLLFPLLSLATKATHAGLDAWRGGHSHPWRGIADALRQTPFSDRVTHEGQLIALRLGLTLPLLEVLLHGVLRQSFGRWGIVGFAVGTAFLAPLLLVQNQLSFFLFGGALVTGIVAARGGSVVPGFAFWMALFAGIGLWMDLIPPPPVVPPRAAAVPARHERGETPSPRPARLRNSASSTTSTPNSFAFLSFDPAASPATTSVVFAEIDAAIRAPAASAVCFASSRESVGSVPVNTTVCPASGPPPAAATGCGSTPAAESFAISAAFLGSANQPWTACAIAGPTSSRSSSASTPASRSASSVLKARASVFAPLAPTSGIPSA